MTAPAFSVLGAVEQAVDDFSKTGQVSAELQDYLEELKPQQKEFLQKVTVAQVKEKDFLNLCSFFRDKGDLEAEDIVRMANESVACFQANPSSTAIRKIREEIYLKKPRAFLSLRKGRKKHFANSKILTMTLIV